MKGIMAIVMVAGSIALSPSVSTAEHNDATEKELCILLARDCADKVYNLHERIKKLQEELARGSTVYTADKIRELKDKLKEAEEMMYRLTPGVPSQKETR